MIEVTEGPLHSLRFTAFRHRLGVQHERRPMMFECELTPFLVDAECEQINADSFRSSMSSMWIQCFTIQYTRPRSSASATGKPFRPPVRMPRTIPKTSPLVDADRADRLGGEAFFADRLGSKSRRTGWGTKLKVVFGGPN